MSFPKRIVLFLGVTSILEAAVWSQACPEWTAQSNQAQARMGEAVAGAGDVNGDGYDDVVVGASQYTNDQPFEGRVALFLGSPSGLVTSPAWMAELDQSAGFARCVAGAGDVNGDGYDDVIVGAAGYSNGEGAAFLYLGSASGPSTDPDWSVGSNQSNTPGFALFMAGAGDVNGDGYDDVLVGAPYYDHGQTDEGRVFLYLGSAKGLSPSAAWTAESDQAFANMGAVAGPGDVNGDGYDDLLVGAKKYDNATGGGRRGRVFLYLGSASGPSATPDLFWENEATFPAGFGTYLAGGDLDGDGYDDVILGSVAEYGYVGFDALIAGRVRVYPGSPSGPSTTPAWSADHDQGAAGHADLSLSVADVNGDAHDDVIVGTLGYESTSAQDDEGRVYVYLGSPAGLAPFPAWSAEGSAGSLEFGSAVSTAGDVHGDGYDDVLVGVPRFSNGQTWEGAAVLYPGSVAFVSAALFAGDGINADLVEPRNIAIGSPWSLPLTLGHAHGAGGTVRLLVRSSTVNGPNFSSPIGGRTTEWLASGTLLAVLSGSHDGATGGAPPITVPHDPALLGLAWAAQYIVLGGGFGDLSQAAYGVVGCQ